LAALSDVHGPRYLNLLNNSLDALEGADLVLLAGDLVERGAAHHCKLVVDRIRSVYGGELLAVFGNEEYDERKEELRRLCSDVKWLDDEYVVTELGGLKVAVVGTRGVLDRPTRWQLRNVPGIREIYRRRLERIEELLREASREAQCVVLLTHYAPICGTLEGEDERVWSQLGSRRLTRVVMRTKPDVVIHGHAHNGKRLMVRLGETRVYNVALPATGRVTRIVIGARGLSAFM